MPKKESRLPKWEQKVIRLDPDMVSMEPSSAPFNDLRSRRDTRSSTLGRSSNGSNSPSTVKIIRGPLVRGTDTRRSLSNMNAMPPWMDEEAPSYRADPMRTHSIYSIDSERNVRPSVPHPLSTIPVSQLPKLSELGFILQPYRDQYTGDCVGIQLHDDLMLRRSIRYKLRHCSPFEAGDVIVTVNGNRLAENPVDIATRCVYTALKEARRNTVEFGVHRPVDWTSPTSWTTLPDRLSRTNRRQSNVENDPLSISDAEILATQHTPRRNPSNTLTRSVVPNRGSDEMSGLDDYKRQPSVVIINADNYAPSNPTVSYASLDRSTLTNSSQQHSRHTNSPAPSSPLIHRRTFSGSTIKDVNAFNTRAIGQKIDIELIKITDGGLGFTLTSRDTQTGAQTTEPVYVKKILSSGAAIADGRLAVGDRLLTVDGLEVESLGRVLNQLRAILPGDPVNLIISRHSSSTPGDDSARCLTPSGASTKSLPARPYTSFTYEYNLPRILSRDGADSPSLGVNFQWCQQPPHANPGFSDTPGLYVVSLAPVGLVQQAGRTTLLPGDHLVGLNGQSLQGWKMGKISARIKHVLTEVAASSPRTPGDNVFSLTVHRYNTANHPNSRGADPQNTNRMSSITDGSDSASFNGTRTGQSDPVHPNVVDTRRRRSSQRRSQMDNDPSGSPQRYLSVPPRNSAKPQFDRDGFGRRSMSEKRIGNGIDANQHPFFQKNILPNRCEMPEDVDKQYSTMPTTRRLKLLRERQAAADLAHNGPMKAVHPHSSNLKHNPDHTDSRDSSQRDEDPNFPGLFRRGRKQNSSFRNAVDRSLTLTGPSEPSPFVPSNEPYLIPTPPPKLRSVGQVVLPNPWPDRSSAPPVSLTETNSVEQVALSKGFPPPQTSTQSIPNYPHAIESEPPPIPVRRSQHFPSETTRSTSFKSSKRGFGSFIERFRRGDKKTNPSIIPVPSPQPNEPDNHRLPVSELITPPARLATTHNNSNRVTNDPPDRNRPLQRRNLHPTTPSNQPKTNGNVPIDRPYTSKSSQKPSHSTPSRINVRSTPVSSPAPRVPPRNQPDALSALNHHHTPMMTSRHRKTDRPDSHKSHGGDPVIPPHPTTPHHVPIKSNPPSQGSSRRESERDSSPIYIPKPTSRPSSAARTPNKRDRTGGVGSTPQAQHTRPSGSSRPRSEFYPMHHSQANPSGQLDRNRLYASNGPAQRRAPPGPSPSSGEKPRSRSRPAHETHTPVTGKPNHTVHMTSPSGSAPVTRPKKRPTQPILPSQPTNLTPAVSRSANGRAVRDALTPLTPSRKPKPTQSRSRT